MRGWLVVNGFLDSAKYQELYALLFRAAERRGITLAIKTGDGIFSDVASDRTLADKPDFVLFWDKDIPLARRLEALRIPLFNSADGVEVCDRKILTALALAKANVPTPKTIPAPKTFEGVGYKNLAFLESAEEILGYPMIIKEDRGSFGAQVYLAGDRAGAVDILKRIGHKDCLLQEFIHTSRGKDVRVNVVGGRVVSAMLRFNGNDFRSNVSNGGKTEKIELTKAQEEIAIAAAEACGLDFAGVDVLFGEGGAPLVCEVNSNPHFKSTLDCTGNDLSEEILAYIVEKLARTTEGKL